MKIAYFCIFVLLVASIGCAQQTKPQTTEEVSTPGIVTEKGSAQAFGEGIVKCIAGTPWEFTTATAGVATYKATYTIDGKTMFKGSEYCKVKGTVEMTGVPGGVQGLSYDYYFKVDPTGTIYSDVWLVINVPGQPTQETHIVTGAAR